MDSLFKIFSQTFFDQIRVSTIQSIEDGDVSLAMIKQHLEKGIEKINRKLDGLMNSDILSSKDFLEKGLLLLASNDEGNAFDCFNKAINDATVGFRKTTSFELKVLAIKVNILSTLHKHYYFDAINSSRKDLQKIERLLVQLWHQLIQEKEVTSAIRDEYERSVFRYIGSQSTRRKILLQLSQIRDNLHSLFPERHQNIFQIKDTKGKEILLEKSKLGSLKAHNNPIRALAIGEGRLYTVSWDNTIKVWETSDEAIPSTPVATIPGQDSIIYALAIDGRGRLFTGSGDKSIKVWEIRDEVISSSPIVTLTDHKDAVCALAIDGGRLFSGSKDKKIKLWDVNKEAIPSVPIATLTGHKNSIKALAVGGGRLYSCSGDKTIKVWDVSNETISPSLILTPTGQNLWLNALAIRFGGLYSGSNDQTVKVWDSSNAEIPLTPIATLTGHNRSINALAMKRGRLYSGSDDQTVNVWDISTSEIPLAPIATLTDHDDWTLNALAIGGGRLFSGIGNGELMIRLC